MISHVINVIKEKEIDALAMPWVNGHVAYLLAVWWATATIEDGKLVEPDPGDYDEIDTTKEGQDHRCLLLSSYTGEDEDSSLGRGNQCDE